MCTTSHLQGEEKCQNRQRIIWPADELLLDDWSKTCSCDEYLAGIKSVVEDGSDEQTKKKVPVRM